MVLLRARSSSSRRSRSAPASFELLGRSPERTVTLGGRHLATVPVSSPPAVSDLDGGKRSGNLADFRDLVRLTQHFDVMHVTGPVRRAAGRAGAVPAPPVGPRLPDADRQGAVPLRARPGPGGGRLRDVPDRLRRRRGDVRLRPALLHGHQQQLAAAARHPDVHGADRLRRRRAGLDHHAVHAGRRDGAGDPRRRAHAPACRGARGHHADAGRAARARRSSTAPSPRTST